jgi:cell wall assembly regulator SMI1
MAVTNRSVAAASDVIHDWLKRECPPLLNNLNPPASDAGLTALEKAVGVVLPEDFKASYRIHDGSHGWPAPMIGEPMLPLEDIARVWTEFKSFVKDWEAMLPIQASFKKGAIKEDAINPKWIPFLGPDEDNYVGLDFDPGPTGTKGQVINFGADEFKYDSKRFVFAPSFGVFLNFVADLMSAGKVVVDQDGCLTLKQIRHDGAKCNLLTGAAMLFGDQASKP